MFTNTDNWQQSKLNQTMRYLNTQSMFMCTCWHSNLYNVVLLSNQWRALKISARVAKCHSTGEQLSLCLTLTYLWSGQWHSWLHIWPWHSVDLDPGYRAFKSVYYHICLFSFAFLDLQSTLYVFVVILRCNLTNKCLDSQ